MLSLKSLFYVQVQVCRMQSKIQNGGAVYEGKTNLRMLVFKHINPILVGGGAALIFL